MKIYISQAIQAIVEAMLTEKTVNKLLFISVRCGYNYFSNGISIEQNDFTCNFIFHRPSNYVKVLFKESDRIFVNPWDLTEMEFKSDHDSCWREDGISTPLNQVHWKHCDKLKNLIAKKKGTQYANNLYQLIHTSYPSFATIETLMLIDGQVDRSDRYQTKFVLDYNKEKQFYTFKSFQE
jgi:hypothetical protein